MQRGERLALQQQKLIGDADVEDRLHLAQRRTRLITFDQRIGRLLIAQCQARQIRVGPRHGGRVHRRPTRICDHPQDRLLRRQFVRSAARMLEQKSPAPFTRLENAEPIGRLVRLVVIQGPLQHLPGFVDAPDRLIGIAQHLPRVPQIVIVTRSGGEHLQRGFENRNGLGCASLARQAIRVGLTGERIVGVRFPLRRNGREHRGEQ